MRITGKVMFAWLCRKMLGPKNEFQVPRNVTRQNAALIGRTSGMTD